MGLDCTGWGYTALGWVGRSWPAGAGCSVPVATCNTARDPGLHCNGLGGVGLDWTGLDWIGLDWIGLDWTGLAIGLDWIGLLVVD